MIHSDSTPHNPGNLRLRGAICGGFLFPLATKRHKKLKKSAEPICAFCASLWHKDFLRQSYSQGSRRWKLWVRISQGLAKGVTSMQRLKNYSILSLTIAILVFSSTTSSQMQEPVTTSPPQQPQGPSKPPGKFVKTQNPIANRYIVVLNDDVVSDKEPLEVRRAAVTAIANSHAQTYGGKVDYIYETALKGYAIELPNEAAAIAISNLPEVKGVEQDAVGQPGMAPSSPEPPKKPESVCRGKTV